MFPDGRRQGRDAPRSIRCPKSSASIAGGGIVVDGARRWMDVLLPIFPRIHSFLSANIALARPFRFTSYLEPLQVVLEGQQSFGFVPSVFSHVRLAGSSKPRHVHASHVHGFASVRVTREWRPTSRTFVCITCFVSSEGGTFGVSSA